MPPVARRSRASAAALLDVNVSELAVDPSMVLAVASPKSRFKEREFSVRVRSLSSLLVIVRSF